MTKDEAEALILNRFEDLVYGSEVGWWHQEDQEDYLGLFNDLVGGGIPVDRAYAILSTAFHAAANEYGD